jgi:hypothetical protein
MSNKLTHEFALADTEDELLEVTVEKDGSINLMFWENSYGFKKTMRNFHIHRADFEQIAATVKMWDDVTIEAELRKKEGVK